MTVLDEPHEVTKDTNVMKDSKSRFVLSNTYSVLLLAALAVGAAGYWGPWIAHRAVALILIGQDLGEFVKFLPEARDGTALIVRQLFYLPPFCACCILALLAASWLRYHWVVRALLLLAILPISLALLPPVFSIPVLKSEEFRLQVIGTLFCLALIPGALLLRRISLALQMALVALFGLLGAAPALWQFSAILPAIQNVYRAPVQLGWGVFATGAGFGTVAVLGVMGTWRLMK